MAKFNPPTNFPFDKLTEWPEWKQRFERYRLATKLNKDNGEVQVSCLIYAMGPKAENIYKSFTFAGNDERNDFAAVVGKFDEYFFPRRNIIHERVCFHQRVQRPGEKAEGFIRALYDLSEHCDFGATREENIRDRIVVAIRDKELSRRLQLMVDLTQTTTIQTVRQSEEVAAQVSLQGDTVGSVQEVQSQRKNANWKPQPKHGKSKDTKWGGNEKKCGRVHVIIATKLDTGGEHVAAADECRRSQRLRAEQTSYFLGSVCDASDKSEQWTVQLHADSTPVEFKIDTGADVTVISEDTFHTLAPERRLEPPDIPLDSPGGELLCLGRFDATIKHKGRGYTFTAYVVRGHRVNNLLSRTLSVKMNLVRWTRYNPTAVIYKLTVSMAL